ncbi:MAG TPA: nicotinate (nicotinamide) nucleotide adenylyltransferase [Terracidiphilus sp.]|nr:nicotinate (nicotinamide) nucleotide adenylyltransferase [Terracidiphilus sp.]
MTHAPRVAFSGGSRVAFFGGSFDPPHSGHIAIARAAQTALALDRVLFAPVGAQPLKPEGSAASFNDRVAMTRLAIAGEPGFELSLLDAPTAKPDHTPNYTIDTLNTLRASLPPGSALFCILGADSFLGLRRWHRGAEIPFAATLVIASRPGESLDNLAALLPAGLTLVSLPEPALTPSGIDLRRAELRNPAGANAGLYLLPGLHIDLSATAIRSQLRSGQPAGIDPAVLDYIATHHLYRSL